MRLSLRHQALSTTVILIEKILGLAGGNRFGQTVVAMRASGTIIEPMVKENSGMQTVIFTKVIGATTRPTDTDYISTQMEHAT